MPITQKCGIAGCKAQIPKRSAICARHRELVDPVIRKKLEALYARRLKGDPSALNPYYHVLAEASLAVTRAEGERQLSIL